MSTDRLSMVDEFGSRRAIIPAEVKGRYRLWRTRVHVVLLFIFLGLPWLRIGNTQAVLLDIPGRHFELFGNVFLSHDSPLLFFILLIFGLGIMLITALWGRIWCGWACPQTVFIDSVYRTIERWVQGSYIERRRMQSEPLSAENAVKSSVKWFLFFCVSSVFAHSFIAYFTGGPELIHMLKSSPQGNWNYFLIVSLVTALLMFNFGWFREQFCILMCPYGRFQGVLLDSQSFSVSYDSKRSDCVDCKRCVQVCPTGIDIRNGLQMECISCTACMDACDDIMRKLKKPERLISYKSASKRPKVNFLRPRVVAYSVLLAFSVGGFVYGLAGHKGFSAVILKAAEAPYQVVPDNKIVNHFKINLHNQSHLEQKLRISLKNPDSDLNLTQATEYKVVAPGTTAEAHVFVSFSRSKLNRQGKLSLQFFIEEVNSGLIQNIEMTAAGPAQD